LKDNKTSIGIGLAILATLIWSGNFIVARGVIKTIPPISLAFYRWLIASVIILPFAWKHLKSEAHLIRRHLPYFLATAATGISMFNTFVYIGGHHSEAINLALIGTTSSPIMSVILARIFLKEKVSALRITGMLICVIGILILLCKGRFENLYSLSFSEGDWWALAAALAFAVYNTLAKKKPASISPVNFLFTAFLLGTLLLLPFYLFEYADKGGFQLDSSSFLILLYLGLGASVICFLIWNIAIRHLGAARTALFGNLIPVFSSAEAVLILGETIRWFHFTGFALVILGLVLANYRR
jgi:drug/metabolite transporter (DMT)-like permease